MAKDLVADVFEIPISTSGPTATSNPCIISFSSDPNALSLSAPTGTLGLRTDAPSFYVKTASNWSQIGFTPGSFSTLTYTATISPAAISGTVNDYSPSSIATASIVRQAVSSTDATLTGINAGSRQVDGAFLILENLGPGSLTLAHDSTSSAINRLYLPGAPAGQCRSMESHS